MSDFKKFLKTSFMCVIIIIFQIISINYYSSNTTYDDIKKTEGTVIDIQITHTRTSGYKHSHSTSTKQRATVEYVNRNGETITKKFNYSMDEDLRIGGSVPIYYDAKHSGARYDDVVLQSHPSNLFASIIVLFGFVLIPMLFVNTSFKKRIYSFSGIVIFYIISFMCICCASI